MKDLLEGLVAFCLLCITIPLVMGIFLVGWVLVLPIVIGWEAYKVLQKIRRKYGYPK